MAQTNHINVKVYPAGGDSGEYEADPLEFDGVNYVSFVSSPGGQGEGTYGIPAMLADGRVKDEGLPVKILYVNPQNISAMLAERIA